MALAEEIDRTGEKPNEDYQYSFVGREDSLG